MRNVLGESRENENTLFMFDDISSENRAVYEII